MSQVNLAYLTPKTIEGYEIDAFLTETYNFTNSVTNLPVEDGTIISDHVTSQPIEISIEAFIGRVKFQAYNSDDTSADDPKARIKEAYFKLRKLKEDRQPLIIVLGLDTFANMVITKFEINRDVKTGADLSFSMSFKQVKIVKSEFVEITASAGGGDQTEGIVNGGTQAANKVDSESGMMQREWQYARQNGRCTQDEYLEVCEKNGWAA
jgi:hypothetical protein